MQHPRQRAGSVSPAGETEKTYLVARFVYTDGCTPEKGNKTVAGLTLGEEWKTGRSHSSASEIRNPLQEMRIQHRHTGVRTVCV